MNYRTTILAAIVSFLPFLLPLGSFGQNVALKSKVTLSSQPNYSYTKGKNDPGFLTDGKYSKANLIWLDKLTLGWQHTPEVTLNFTLAGPVQLDRLTLNTASSPSADVALPLNIHAFASMDGERFSYLGDFMAKSKKAPGHYAVTKLQLTNVNAPAKYLRLIVVPKGSMFFTDEVEIHASGKAKSAQSGGKLYTAAEIAAFVQQASAESRNEQFSRVTQAQTASAGLEKDLVLQRYTSPWEGASPAGELPVEMVTCLNTTEYVAYRLLNNTSGKINTQLKWKNKGSLDIVTYTAREVKTRKFKLVPDAWEPVGQNHQVSLGPGESKIIIVALCASAPGNYSPELEFSGGKNTGKANLRVNVKNIKTAFAPGERLNVDVWAYFNTPFLKDRQAAAKSDLLDHYVNTYFVAPQIAVPALINHEMTAFEKYISQGRGFDKVFLFLNFRTYVQSGQDYFMSDSWKSRFLKGYDAVMALMEERLPESTLYLYPFDEVRNNEIASYLKFTEWIKSERESAKIFLTVFDPALVSKIKGTADIYQVLDRGKTLTSGVLGGERLWLYEIMDASKSLPPYEKYRLLGWKAFAHQLEGIGFWSYSDVRGEESTSAWNDFDGNNADYTAVYDQGDTFIPSRRWEAFKAGIEDYMLLKMYARKAGEEKARELARSVLNEPGNTQKADIVRRKIINEL